MTRPCMSKQWGSPPDEGNTLRGCAARRSRKQNLNRNSEERNSEERNSEETVLVCGDEIGNRPRMR